MLFELDGLPVVGVDYPLSQLRDLGPVAWISDELMSRATWVTSRCPPGEPPFAVMRVGLESWVRVVRNPHVGEPLRFWTIEITTPIYRGEKRGRRLVYLLEDSVRREDLKLTRMRWQD